MAPAPDVYTAPVPEVEYITPVPAVIAALAFVVEYIVPASAVTYVAPTPVVHAATAFVVEYIAPAPVTAWQRPLGSNRLSILISSH